MSTISKDAKVHMRCLSVAAPFFSMNSKHSHQVMDEQNIYASELRLAKVYPEPSLWDPNYVGGCREIFRTFLKIKSLHLVVPIGQRMWYTSASENICRRLRLLKIRLSLEVAGSLSTEWDVLEEFCARGALTLAEGSMIEALPPIPFPHQQPRMSIRRGGILKASGQAVNDLHVYRHLLRVAEVVGLHAHIDSQDIYDVIDKDTAGSGS